MSFSIRFGNLSLDGCVDFAIASNSRVSDLRFPRRPGSIAPQVPAADSKRISISGETFQDSEALMISYLDSLNAALTDQGRSRLFLRTNDRYVFAVKTGFNHSFSAQRLPLLRAGFAIEFLADDPYWYGLTESSDVQTLVAANLKTWAVTNNGGTRTPPVIEISRTSAANDQANVKITQSTTGQYMQWTGSLASGTKLLFDCVNSRCSVAGGNGLNAFSGSFFNLESGLNNLRYDGPGNVTITTNWRERWS